MFFLRKQFFKTLVFILAITAPLVCAAGESVSILSHAAVQDLVVHPATKPVHGPILATESKTVVTFSAMGNELVLELVPNDRLVAGVRSLLTKSNIEYSSYRGFIRSIPGSWARVSIENDVIRGVVFDGAELLIIDKASRLEGLQGYAGDPNTTLVIRAKDVVLTVDEPLGDNGLLRRRTMDKLVKASEAAALAAATTRAVSLGLVLDNEFADSNSEEVQLAIEFTNIADGIFSAQANIHLNIEHILNYDDTPDPFTTSNPEALLGELTDLKESDPNLSSLGLVHLFTRVNLDGDTLGIAQIASFCAPDQGTGLTEARGSTVDALVMAHEIGHNFGARHDGEEGSGCESTPTTFLMSATVNDSKTFSQCSLDTITQVLAGASCLTAVPTSEIYVSQPVIPATIYYGERILFDYNVSNSGTESALDGRLDVSTSNTIDLYANGSQDRPCQQHGPQLSHSCDLANLYAGETVAVGYAMDAKELGQIQLDATVSASNDTDQTNNSIQTFVEVLEATDMVAYGDANVDGSTDIKAGESIAYTATALNQGDFDAQATLTVTTDPMHSLSTTSACNVVNGYTLQCDMGIVPAAASRSIQFVLHSDPTIVVDSSEYLRGVVYLDVDSSVHDIRPDNENMLYFAIWGTIKDLYSEFVEPPDSIEEGETIELEAVFGNLGPDFAPTINASLRTLGVKTGVRLGTATPSRGTCEAREGESEPEGRVDCEIGGLEPGETVTVRIPLTGDVAGQYQIQADSSVNFGHESNQENNFQRIEVTVLAPPPPPPPPAPPPRQKSGGGGVSIFWFALLLLCARNFGATRPAAISRKQAMKYRYIR